MAAWRGRGRLLPRPQSVGGQLEVRLADAALALGQPLGVLGV